MDKQSEEIEKLEKAAATNFIVGLVSLVFCHLALAGLLWLAFTLANVPTLPDWFNRFSAASSSILLIAIFAVGLTQLLYALPLWLFLRAVGRRDTAKGVLTGVIFTLLLNGGCFVIFVSGL